MKLEDAFSCNIILWSLELSERQGTSMNCQTVEVTMTTCLLFLMPQCACCVAHVFFFRKVEKKIRIGYGSNYVLSVKFVVTSCLILRDVRIARRHNTFEINNTNQKRIFT